MHIYTLDLPYNNTSRQLRWIFYLCPKPWSIWLCSMIMFVIRWVQHTQLRHSMLNYAETTKQQKHTCVWSKQTGWLATGCLLQRNESKPARWITRKAYSLCTNSQTQKWTHGHASTFKPAARQIHAIQIKCCVHLPTAHAVNATSTFTGTKQRANWSSLTSKIISTSKERASTGSRPWTVQKMQTYHNIRTLMIKMTLQCHCVLCKNNCRRTPFTILHQIFK